ncbi:MAG: NAD-dependent epimerase/dehydratase family protein, partial [Gammaproteobacteria bacterium]|nr:NAD-dependent epimerase/dehydratase family protein [Gammaproteobacteria bacterium]
MSAAVLVTGGAGYIGSHTCKALAAAGFLPVAYDNLSHGHCWAVRWGPLVEGDIHDRDRLTAAMRHYDIEAIVHFAAFAYVGESMHEPGRYFANNVAGSLSLLEVALASGNSPVVFSSSCATYGVPAHTPIAETHPQLPCNPYGESKLFVERALHWYGEAHGTPWISLR